jgi:hypothetical protein
MRRTCGAEGGRASWKTFGRCGEACGANVQMPCGDARRAGGAAAACGIAGLVVVECCRGSPSMVILCACDNPCDMQWIRACRMDCRTRRRAKQWSGLDSRARHHFAPLPPARMMPPNPRQQNDRLAASARLRTTAARRRKTHTRMCTNGQNDHAHVHTRAIVCRGACFA